MVHSQIHTYIQAIEDMHIHKHIGGLISWKGYYSENVRNIFIPVKRRCDDDRKLSVENNMRGCIRKG